LPFIIDAISSFIDIILVLLRCHYDYYYLLPFLITHYLAIFYAIVSDDSHFILHIQTLQIDYDISHISFWSAIIDIYSYWLRIVLHCHRHDLLIASFSLIAISIATPIIDYIDIDDIIITLATAIDCWHINSQLSRHWYDISAIFRY